MERVNLTPFEFGIDGNYITLKNIADKTVKRYRVVMNSEGSKTPIKDKEKLESVVFALHKFVEVQSFDKQRINFKDLSKTTLSKTRVETDQFETNRVAGVAKKRFDMGNINEYSNVITNIFESTMIDMSKPPVKESEELDGSRLKEQGAGPVDVETQALKVDKAAKPHLEALGNFFRRVGHGIVQAAKWVWSHTIGALVNYIKNPAYAKARRQIFNLPLFKSKVNPQLAKDAIDVIGKTPEGRDILTRFVKSLNHAHNEAAKYIENNELPGGVNSLSQTPAISAYYWGVVQELNNYIAIHQDDFDPGMSVGSLISALSELGGITNTQYATEFIENATAKVKIIRGWPPANLENQSTESRLMVGQGWKYRDRFFSMDKTDWVPVKMEGEVVRAARCIGGVALPEYKVGQFEIDIDFDDILPKPATVEQSEELFAILQEAAYRKINFNEKEEYIQRLEVDFLDKDALDRLKTKLRIWCGGIAIDFGDLLDNLPVGMSRDLALQMIFKKLAVYTDPKLAKGEGKKISELLHVDFLNEEQNERLRNVLKEWWYSPKPMGEFDRKACACVIALKDDANAFPDIVTDVSNEFVNPKMVKFMEKFEQVLGRKLVDVNELRALVDWMKQKDNPLDTHIFKKLPRKSNDMSNLEAPISLIEDTGPRSPFDELLEGLQIASMPASETI